ncbi:MAG TPA: hypothetical protein PLA97_23370 [Rubrivivax sp.]|nr:hypothetical protein [Rubrivivax sp.]
MSESSTRMVLAFLSSIEPSTRTTMPTGKSACDTLRSSNRIVVPFVLNSTPLTQTLPNAVIVQ